MNDLIKVDFGSLAQAHADMMATTQKLQQRLDQLENDLRPLVATWTGQAAELYQAKQRQWHNAAADMQTSLGQLGGAVSQSHDAFQQAEAQNASMF
jgi:WXG100 family type VII secretion target